MQRQKSITTREFLRNFRALKEQLIRGEVMYITINAGKDDALRVERCVPGLTGSELARRILGMKRPISVRRPQHLFDDLLPRSSKHHGKNH